MIDSAKYVHTNLVAHDWRRLAHFYQEVLGCVPVPPERNLCGPDYELGVAGGAAVPTAVNRPGFGHVAFSVTSVVEARDQFLRAGGSSVGDVVRTTISADEVVTWCYVRDPEGNIVELQSRSQGAAV